MTKKNVAKTLEERMIEAFRMGHNGGISIHPEIDALQGEVRVPRDLSGQSCSACVCACVRVSSPPSFNRTSTIRPQTTSAA